MYLIAKAEDINHIANASGVAWGGPARPADTQVTPLANADVANC